MKYLFLNSDISNMLNQHANDTQNYFQSHKFDNSLVNIGGFFKWLMHAIMQFSDVFKYINVIYFILMLIGCIILSYSTVGNSGEKKDKGIWIMIPTYIFYIVIRILILGVLGMNNFTPIKALLVVVVAFSQILICCLAPVLLAVSAQNMQFSGLLGENVDESTKTAPMRNTVFVLGIFILFLLFIGVNFG